MSKKTTLAKCLQFKINTTRNAKDILQLEINQIREVPVGMHLF